MPEIKREEALHPSEKRPGEMLDEILQRVPMQRLTTWELKFIADQVDNRARERTPTDRQIESIRNIWSKTCLEESF